MEIEVIKKTVLWSISLTTKPEGGFMMASKDRGKHVFQSGEALKIANMTSRYDGHPDCSRGTNLA